MFTVKANPKVSIIMPSYNRADYIVEAVESIQKQTYQNWELLIIDDGSTDDTGQVVRKIRDGRIDYFSAGRIGMEEARNTGLKRASGDFIAFMDSDDLWIATKLEKQINSFKIYPEASFCLTGGYEFYEMEKPTVCFYKHKEGVKFGDLLIPFFRSEVAATMPTLMLKKKCIGITGGFSEEKPIPHIDFILKLATNFKGIILYEPLFYRRLHASNYSSLNAVKRHADGIEMIRSYKNVLPLKLYADALFRSYINFGGKYLEHKREGKAIYQFLQAWRYKPFSIVPVKKTGKAIWQFLKPQP